MTAPLNELEVRISASPAEVWRALREPDEIGRWFGWDYEGIGPEIQMIFVDEATEAEPGSRLELAGGDAFVVEPAGEGTAVRIEREVATEEPWDVIHEGWIQFLYQLGFYLERHQGSPRRTLRLSGDASGETELMGALSEDIEPHYRTAHQAGYELPDGSLLVVVTRPGTPEVSLTLSIYGS